MNTDQHRQRRFAVTYDLTQRAQRGAESAEKTIEKAAARALRRHAHSRVNAASQPFLAGPCFSAFSALLALPPPPDRLLRVIRPPRAQRGAIRRVSAARHSAERRRRTPHCPGAC